VAGFEDEAARLGDGHEVADDLLVGDGDGATVADLPPEEGDHRAVAAEDIPEAGGDESGFHVIVVKERAGVHLADPFGGAHHVGGVDGLVGGDHDELFDPVFHGQVGDGLGALDVGAQGLIGELLHERDVFIGRGVEDDIGHAYVEDPAHAAGVVDAGDHGVEAEVGVA